MANTKLDCRQGQDFHLDEEGANRKPRKRRRLRVIIPAYPAFNVYSRIARTTTALGPVSVATSVQEMEGWDVEVIDENNYQRSAPRNEAGLPDHEALQKSRPADVVGFYGGLSSTILRVYELARFYKERGVSTLAGGQHFIEENIPEALRNGIDVVVKGEAEETIKELLYAFEGRLPREEIKGIAYLDNDQVIQTKERELLRDFNHLPLPDFSLVRYAKIRIFPVGRVRGCGMDCEFCTVKGKPRYATPNVYWPKLPLYTRPLEPGIFSLLTIFSARIGWKLCGSAISCAITRSGSRNDSN